MKPHFMLLLFACVFVSGVLLGQKSDTILSLRDEHSGNLYGLETRDSSGTIIRSNYYQHDRIYTQGPIKAPSVNNKYVMNGLWLSYDTAGHLNRRTYYRNNKFIYDVRFTGTFWDSTIHIRKNKYITYSLLEGKVMRVMKSKFLVIPDLVQRIKYQTRLTHYYYRHDPAIQLYRFYSYNGKLTGKTRNLFGSEFYSWEILDGRKVIERYSLGEESRVVKTKSTDGKRISIIRYDRHQRRKKELEYFSNGSIRKKKTHHKEISYLRNGRKRTKHIYYGGFSKSKYWNEDGLRRIVRTTILCFGLNIRFEKTWDEYSRVPHYSLGHAIGRKPFF